MGLDGLVLGEAVSKQDRLALCETCASAPGELCRSIRRRYRRFVPSMRPEVATHHVRAARAAKIIKEKKR